MCKFTVRLNRFESIVDAGISKRIDRRLLPILGAMYAISLIDRTNLGLAAIAGMNVDLELTGDRYTIVIMLFFVMYIIFESASSPLPLLSLLTNSPSPK